MVIRYWKTTVLFLFYRFLFLLFHSLCSSLCCHKRTSSIVVFSAIFWYYSEYSEKLSALSLYVQWFNNALTVCTIVRICLPYVPWCSLYVSVVARFIPFYFILNIHIDIYIWYISFECVQFVSLTKRIKPKKRNTFSSIPKRSDFFLALSNSDSVLCFRYHYYYMSEARGKWKIVSPPLAATTDDI